MKVYIASKMSGLKDFNYPAFHRTAAHLRRLGFEVENPAENPDPPCGSWNGYLKTALRQLLTCDALVLLPGWETSRGANLERETALKVGLPVYALAKFLSEFSDVNGFDTVLILAAAQPSDPDPSAHVDGSPAQTNAQSPQWGPIGDADRWPRSTSPVCTCGEKLAAQCPGEWEPGCDLGQTAEHASAVEIPAFLRVNPGEKPTNPKDAIGVRKAPLSCVPAGVIAEIGVGMLEGAAKYGRFNFRGVGVRASVYYDAAMRHLFAWWEGEDIDPDSGLHHVAKALTTLAVLRDAQIQAKCSDDRPPRSAAFYARLNEQASAILDRHADKAPKHWTIADAV